MEYIVLGITICFVILGLAFIGWAAQELVRESQPKHEHDGHETGRRWVPGIMDTGGEVSGIVDDKLLYGYTEITYKCDCGHYWNERVLGKINT